MIGFISRGHSWLYAHVAKPLLFLLPADSVHETMIRSGGIIQKLSPIRGVFRALFSYHDPLLEQTVCGIHYRNPLGLSAGLDKDAKIVGLLQAIGFGFAECGSVTFGSYEGNPRPWYTRLPKSKSILVNSGLRSQGAPRVIARAGRYSEKLLGSFPLNISIAKTNSSTTNTIETGVADYVNSFKLWEKSGNARLYTINISCPNTFGGEPFTDPVSLDALLREVDALNVTKPIFVKFPIDKSWAETKALLTVCAEHNVQGITLGNLYKDRKTVQLKDVFDQNLKGNFSGKPCWDASNALLARMYAEYHERFIFSGVGGVFTAEDAYTKIRLGATLVEMVTGLIFQGPSIVGEINKGLAELLKRDGFTNVSQAIGIDVKKRKVQS